MNAVVRQKPALSGRLPAELKDTIALPVIAAPMFLVSCVESVMASRRAGIIGALPVGNARNPAIFEEWMAEVRAAEQLAEAEGITLGPLAVNVATPKFGGRRWPADMDVIRKYRPPIVITAIGDPTEVVEQVHAYGGKVFHDATTIKHAKKAVEVGVDGINIICGGAGGHAGLLNPFAFVAQIRQFFDGILCLAGAVSNGEAILAAQALGADLVYMGTRFIATQESAASDDYKQMLMAEQSAGITYTDSVSGMPANFIKNSIEQGKARPDGEAKPWKDIWSAGHGIGLIDDVPSTSALVARLHDEYCRARQVMCSNESSD